jgi:hypothetical protein
MIRWDALHGVEAWEAVLNELLAKARSAASKGEEGEAERKEISDLLVEFVRRSRPNDEEILALDEVASKAAIDLLKTTIDGRIEGIAARSTELARLGKQFEILAEKGKADAASIRLERIREVAQGLTATVASLQGLKATLTEGSDEELAAAIERGIKQVQDLRKLVEAKGPLTRA